VDEHHRIDQDQDREEEVAITRYGLSFV